MITRLAHVCLLSTDLEKCEAFYCGVLGLPKQFDFSKQGKAIGFYLKVSDRQFIEVFLRGEAPPEKGNLITHLCLEVESVAAITEHLRQNGIEAREPKRGADHSWQTWCKDPDGIDIEFHEYTPESQQLAAPGGVCEVNW